MSSELDSWHVGKEAVGSYAKTGAIEEMVER